MSDSVFLAGIFILIILCVGKPGLLDGFIQMANQCPK